MDPKIAFEHLCGVIDDLIEKASDRKIDITHIAMCSFWHSLVGVDMKYRPTTSVLGWADTRSGNYSAVPVSYTHLTLPTICSV